MSRSGYSDEWDKSVAMWRGVIASASRGKRGQRFFRDLVAALDAMPVKALVAGELQTTDGAVCALGALGRHRGHDLTAVDTYDHDALGETFDIARQLAAETMYENDERAWQETPEQRWTRVRKWAVSQIRPPAQATDTTTPPGAGGGVDAPGAVKP